MCLWAACERLQTVHTAGKTAAARFRFCGVQRAVRRCRRPHMSIIECFLHLRGERTSTECAASEILTGEDLAHRGRRAQDTDASDVARDRGITSGLAEVSAKLSERLRSGKARNIPADTEAIAGPAGVASQNRRHSRDRTLPERRLGGSGEVLVRRIAAEVALCSQNIEVAAGAVEGRARETAAHADRQSCKLPAHTDRSGGGGRARGEAAGGQRHGRTRESERGRRRRRRASERGMQGRDARSSAARVRRAVSRRPAGTRCRKEG